MRTRGSSPKLQVLNTSLMAALSARTFEQTRADALTWGGFVESAVGAYLLAIAPAQGFEVRYWRKGSLEIDFALERDGELTAVDVKSGATAGSLAGLAAFSKQYPVARPLLVGAEGVPLGALLSGEVSALAR